MPGFTGFIDPPSLFDSRSTWQKYLDELRKLPSSPEVESSIADAEAAIKVVPADDDEEDLDDVSDLEEEE